jgi:hypothetical protein
MLTRQLNGLHVESEEGGRIFSGIGADWRGKLTCAGTSAEISADSVLLADALSLAGAVGLGIGVERHTGPAGENYPAPAGGFILPAAREVGPRTLAYQMVHPVAWLVLEEALGKAYWQGLTAEAKALAAGAFSVGWTQGKAL